MANRVLSAMGCSWRVRAGEGCALTSSFYDCSRSWPAEAQKAIQAEGWGDALFHMCASSGRCGLPAPPSSPFYHSSGVEMAMRSGSVYTIRYLTDATPWQHLVALLLLEMLARLLGPSWNSNAASYVLLYFFAGHSRSLFDFTLAGKNIRHSFIPMDEETDAQRGQSVCSRSHASWRQSQD